MSESAGKYVQTVNEHFYRLTRIPVAGLFFEYEEACRTGELDPDVVEAFNRASDDYEADFASLTASIDAQTTTGDYLFRCSGYAVVARRQGITAVHAAQVHIDKPLSPDPVEALYPGYSNMALIKAGRAALDANYPWSSLGHAFNFSSGEATYAGATGMLFMHGVDDVRDIRKELLAQPAVAETLTGVDPIDQTAGLADELRSQITLGIVPMPVDLDAIKSTAVRYTEGNINIH